MVSAVNHTCRSNKPPKYDTSGAIISGKDPDVSVFKGMFQSFSDAPGGSEEEWREVNLSTGVELSFHQFAFLRYGIFKEHFTKGNRNFHTIGLGLNFAMASINLAYLVPFQQKHPLENTVRYGLTVLWFRGLNCLVEKKTKKT